MTLQELVDRLRELRTFGDAEGAHLIADDLLLEYIDQQEVREAFGDIEKWYA